MRQEKSITISASARACNTSKCSDKTGEYLSVGTCKNKGTVKDRKERITQKCPELNDRRSGRALGRNVT